MWMRNRGDDRMRDTPVDRRDLLKLGGASVISAPIGTIPTSAQTGDDASTGRINSLTGFENPLPITVNSDRFQLVTPVNELTIDAETDDIIDLVFEWDESLTIENGSRIWDGVSILRDQEHIGEQHVIFRGEGHESDDLVDDAIVVNGLDTSDMNPGDEVSVRVSARQASSETAVEDFEDVIATVENGTFEGEETTEATFEVVQGTIISANQAETSDLDISETVDLTIAFDIDQIRNEDAGGTPRGPAEAIYVDMHLTEDRSDFDLHESDVTLGGAAANLDVEIMDRVDEGLILLEIVRNNTLENDANLQPGDTVTLEFNGIEFADINATDVAEFPTAYVGLHGSTTVEYFVRTDASRAFRHLVLSPYTNATNFEFNGVEDGTGILFREATEAADNPLMIAGGGAATAGLGYLAYRNFKGDQMPEPTEETTSRSDEEASAAVVSEPSTTRSISIDQYDDLHVGETIERHGEIQISQATAQDFAVWVLTPDQDGETIDASKFDEFEDRIDPWTNIDSHFNLLSVYGSGSEPLPWVAVEPAEHPSLLDRSDDLTTDETLLLLTQACDAIHHIQRYGLAYEYLSAHSVLVNEESATLQGVLDHITADEDSYELPSTDEDPTTEQADVYRLGAFAYEVLTGSQPAHPDLTHPSERNPELPDTLNQVLLTALAEIPGDRYDTVLHLRDELQDMHESIDGSMEDSK